MATKKPAKKKVKKPAAKKPVKSAQRAAKKSAVAKKPAKKAAPKKKVAKKPVAKVVKAPKPIGRVTHYFDKLEVAVIRLEPGKTLKVGDTIRIEGGETDFKQKIDSLQVEHESVDKVKAGDDFGIKVSELVREGYRVHNG